MGLEAATFLSDLNSANPTAGDQVLQGDDHIRLMKAALQATLPSADHAIYLERPQADLASAATCNIGAQTTNYVNITGVVAITSFGVAAAGIWRLVRFGGILTLTHNATALILPGGANIATAADDRLLAMSLGGGNWIVLLYQKASGSAVVGASAASITLAMLADLAQSTVIGRAAGAGTGVPQALTSAQLTAIADAFVGDSGSGGTKGEVPAPAAGDAAAGKLLGAGGAWVAPATQAQQETGTTSLAFVTPGNQQNHLSAAKFLAYITVSGGTPTLAMNNNVTSIADTGVGIVTITIGTDFSSVNWVPTVTCQHPGSIIYHFIQTQAAGSLGIAVFNSSGIAADPASYAAAGFGDQ